ncbi:MAG: hypothetical protein K0A94_10360 [Desulfuromonadales bacterium]|nr:hypothetical protein [Desulfuromonadales bacterium]
MIASNHLKTEQQQLENLPFELYRLTSLFTDTGVNFIGQADGPTPPGGAACQH